MSKFIVTGGLGFIGSNLVKYLINLGHHVINIDNATYSSNFYNINNIKKNKRYKFFKIDISNKSKIKNIILKYNPKCIFNLAAETHVDRSIDNSDIFLKSNINGVHSLLEAILASKKKIKLIHVSTDEVFGDLKSKRASEKFPYKPRNPYSATKAAADHLINSYSNTYNLNTIITNCCNNYGPGQNPEKFIPKMISSIFKNKNLLVYGSGKNSREWIYVLDHCKALYKIFRKGKAKESYNIGTNQNFKNIDIAKKIISLSKRINLHQGKSKILFVKDRPGHDLRYALDSSKINKKLKWKYKVDINEGLLKTINWYLENKKFYKFVKNKNFVTRLGKIR